MMLRCFTVKYQSKQQQQQGLQGQFCLWLRARVAKAALWLGLIGSCLASLSVF
jgi:purine-cytosine permease-like protein